MKRAFCISTVLMVAMAAPAAAAWYANVDGPDVFGQTKVLAGEGSQRESIIVQCNSKDELMLAFIERKKEFADVAPAAATLLVQVDSGEPYRLDADYRSWNDNYAGIVASDRAAILPVINAIKGAKSKVNVGAELFGNQISASFGARGSTSAIQKVIDGCKLTAAPPT